MMESVNLLAQERYRLALYMNYLQPGQADLSTDTNIDFFDPKLKPATRRFTIRASFAFAVKSFCCPRCPKKCKRHR